MPSPAPKAGHDALGVLKDTSKESIKQGKDIYAGDLEDEPATTPDPEPKIARPSVTPRNAPPTGSAGVRGAKGGGRSGGSGGGGGGGKLPFGRSGSAFGGPGIGPEELQLMQKGGSVGFAKGGGSNYGQDYRKGK